MTDPFEALYEILEAAGATAAEANSIAMVAEVSGFPESPHDALQELRTQERAHQKKRDANDSV